MVTSTSRTTPLEMTVSVSGKFPRGHEAAQAEPRAWEHKMSRPNERATCMHGIGLTLCPAEAGRFLVPPGGAPLALAGTGMEAPSPQAFAQVLARTRSRLPGGTVLLCADAAELFPQCQRQGQDIACRVLVPVQHQCAVGANMRAGAECLPHQSAAA